MRTSRAATADLLSAPRIVSPAERITPSSPSTGAIASDPDSTVSMCATNSSRGADGAPGTVAIRLPASEPLTAPASSNAASMPASASHAWIASPTARSRPLGDGIAASAQNSSSIEPSRGSAAGGSPRGTRYPAAAGTAPSSESSCSEVITSENIG